MYSKEEAEIMKKQLYQYSEFRNMEMLWKEADPNDPDDKVDFVAFTPKGEEMINDTIVEETEEEMMELDLDLYFGDMRLTYLRYEKPQLMRELFVEKKLIAHLEEIQQRTVDFIDLEKPRMMESWNLTAELKIQDPQKYHSLMNHLSSSLTEILIKEIVES